jgi:hypothetical protein
MPYYQQRKQTPVVSSPFGIFYRICAEGEPQKKERKKKKKTTLSVHAWERVHHEI